MTPEPTGRHVRGVHRHPAASDVTPDGARAPPTPAAARPSRRPPRLRHALRPPPRPAVGGGAAHHRQPRDGRRPAGQPGRGVPADPARSGDAVTTWLHRVVVNACLDRMRAARVRRAEPLPDDLEGTATAARWSRRAPRPPTTPPRCRSATNAGRRCSYALRVLPDEQRAALVLVDMEVRRRRGRRRSRLCRRDREVPLLAWPRPARGGSSAPARCRG